MFDAGFSTVFGACVATVRFEWRSYTSRVVRAPANAECAIHPLIVSLIVAAPAWGTAAARETAAEHCGGAEHLVRLRDGAAGALKNRRLGPA